MFKNGKTIFSALFLFSIFTCCSKSDNIIDLTGKWEIELDPNGLGETEQWFNKKLIKTLQLPGSLQGQGYGETPGINTPWTGSFREEFLTQTKNEKYLDSNDFKTLFWLTPDKYYKGVAWYQKNIIVPKNWLDKRITLNLERCHWLTHVFIDSIEAGKDSSLATPHLYDLTDLVSPGQHTLTIKVDNSMIVDVGENAHSVSDNTQSNWNGIVGDMLLIAGSKIFIQNVKVYPDVNKKKVVVEVSVKNLEGQKTRGHLALKVKSLSQRIKLDKKVVKFEIKDEETVKINYPMGESPLLWDEFEPNLYQMDVLLKSGNHIDNKSTTFGMREFKVKGTRFAINDKPVFLRGTLECAIFPKTVYPPTESWEWLRIFKVIKEHGLNHVRFHSWCPPEAAFVAADIEGIYLHVEVNSWTTVGLGTPIDTYLYSEGERIVNEYGNHPSFCMMAYGNEPGSWEDAKRQKRDQYLSNWVKYWKAADSRRVYTSGAGWPITSENEFHSILQLRLGGHLNKNTPNTDHDYKEEYIIKYDKPIVTHEMGQWCAYPNFAERTKFTGYLKPKYLDIFQDAMEENRLYHQAHEFLMASGKLQTLSYKEEIETGLRTQGYAGFQLLGLHDFPGQGTAFVGILDVFWDSKPYVTPKEFTRFCNATVPLARMKKRIFKNNENFQATLEVAHFNKTAIDSARIIWKITNNGETTISSKDYYHRLELGNCHKVGNIDIPLNQITNAQKLKLEVEIENYNTNSWDFWVYPDSIELDVRDIILTDTLTEDIEAQLNKGAKVLLQLYGKVKNEKGGDIGVGFSSIFWNIGTSQQSQTLGILCKPENPLFHSFPTEYHTNWQWWDILTSSEAMILKDFPDDLSLSVQLIDDWTTARRLGLLFEGNVGNGKIMITSIDFKNDLEQRPASRQLYSSILGYMNSDSFNPDQQINIEMINKLYK